MEAFVPDLKWWQKAVFYQIYPRSFADGNGDGIGDFIGMTEKLDFLQKLSVDAVWLSPHYPSPQADCGYDISDYTDVAPEYGTLADFRRFLDEAHARSIHMILDLVLNHTSDQHRWFLESQSGLDSPKRDWYIRQFRDLWGIWNYRAAVEKLKLPPDEALRWANEAGRDKNRTPYQWERAANGGFSPAGAETWLPVNPNWADGVNAEDQAEDPSSLLNFYRALLRVRRNTPALIAGEWVPVHEEAEQYVAVGELSALTLEPFGVYIGEVL